MRSGGIHYAERHAPSRACSSLICLAMGAAVLGWGVSAALRGSAPDPGPIHGLAESRAVAWVPSVVVGLVVLRRMKLRVARYLAWWLLASGL